MFSLTLLGAVVALLGQQPDASTTRASDASACTTSVVTPSDVAVTQLCAAEQALQRGVAAAKASPERTRQFEAAAAGFRRAVNLSTNTQTTTRALSLLATAYDRDHLNAPTQEEQVLRELIAVTPDDLTPIFRLAKLQESRELIDAAEATLLDARHRQPESEEPNRMLAQFYARRVTALHARTLTTAPETVSNPGEADANGVYRIGGALPAPKRSDVPQYPPDAAAAGISGQVQAEIVIDPSGSVASARIVHSIPMLDEAALNAVRGWHFAPTMINGQPVPVRMTVTVNFAPRK